MSDKMFDQIDGNAAFKFNENGYNEYDVRVNFYPRNAEKEAELMAQIARLASIAEAAEQVDFHKKFLPKGTGYLEDAIYKLSGALAAYRQIVKIAENEKT